MGEKKIKKKVMRKRGKMKKIFVTLIISETKL